MISRLRSQLKELDLKSLEIVLSSIPRIHFTNFENDEFLDSVESLLGNLEIYRPISPQIYCLLSRSNRITQERKEFFENLFLNSCEDFRENDWVSLFNGYQMEQHFSSIFWVQIQPILENAMENFEPETIKKLMFKISKIRTFNQNIWIRIDNIIIRKMDKMTIQ